MIHVACTKCDAQVAVEETAAQAVCGHCGTSFALRGQTTAPLPGPSPRAGHPVPTRVGFRAPDELMEETITPPTALVPNDLPAAPHTPTHPPEPTMVAPPPGIAPPPDTPTHAAPPLPPADAATVPAAPTPPAPQANAPHALGPPAPLSAARAAPVPPAPAALVSLSPFRPTKAEALRVQLVPHLPGAALLFLSVAVWLLRSSLPVENPELTATLDRQALLVGELYRVSKEADQAVAGLSAAKVLRDREAAEVQRLRREDEMLD